MKITLGKFACFCLESRFGPDLESGTREALRYYAGRLRSTVRPLPPPLFLPDLPAEQSRVELELTVEPEVREMLELEALRREVYLGRVLSHAVFVCLADGDSPESDRFGPAKEEAASAR